MRTKLRRFVVGAREARPGVARAPKNGPFGNYVNAAEFVRQWLFDPRFYLANAIPRALTPTAGPAELWTHFVQKGQFEDISPSPFLDVAFARRAAAARGCDATKDLFVLWKELGSRFAPGPVFDPTHYLMRNPDIRLAGLDPFFHWMMYGIFEGRSPSPCLLAHALGDPNASDEERRDQVHAVDSNELFVATHASTSSINIATLRGGFPELDPFEGLASGEIPFCTDPQVLFGDVTEVLSRVPSQLACLDTGAT